MPKAVAGDGTSLSPELVTRLLHQVDFVAQQTPLDSTTYGLASMLLSQVTALEGIGTEPNSDEAQEQLTLAVSITGACVGECKSTPFLFDGARELGADVQSWTRIILDWRLSEIFFE